MRVVMRVKQGESEPGSKPVGLFNEFVVDNFYN